PRPARPADAARAARPARGTDPLPAPALSTGGIVRHALTFTVKPGSERAVHQLLSGYRSPHAEVDATTRLCRTSLFMHGNRVVRAVEVQGDLGNALRHVAMQPGVRAVEEAINPYLEEARDLTDPASARAFFARAALPAVHHCGARPAAAAGPLTRSAFLYPVRPGGGEAAAKLLAEQDRAAVAEPGSPLAGSSMFRTGDLLVRMVDLRGPHQDAPVAAAGIPPGGAGAAIARYLDLEYLDLPADTDLSTEPGLARFLAACVMDLVTDRHAASPEPHAAGGARTTHATGE
ncbi:SchA/CurD-like domain-containing protein, partial [Kitasatospora sp. LaBMicrA B282]|uniref:SchA/CurD-like domain-containing protein n=1 Tax=Kitasatospora sp. LaBMicrA B282 TaxID=3420949 RepID=UPI003D0CC831